MTAGARQQACCKWHSRAAQHLSLPLAACSYLEVEQLPTNRCVATQISQE